MQQIIKLSPTKFNVSWSQRPEQKDKVVIDFQAIINYFALSGNFVLIHWQSKPFGLRRWGAYDNSSQDYHAFDFDQIELNVSPMRLLQRPEKQNVLPPSAVILIENARLVKKGDRLFTEAS